MEEDLVWGEDVIGNGSGQEVVDSATDDTKGEILNITLLSDPGAAKSRISFRGHRSFKPQQQFQTSSRNSLSVENSVHDSQG